MTRLAVLPHPAARETQPTDRRHTLEELAIHLTASRSQIDALVRDGLPCIDISRPRPGRRRKRCLRFLMGEVEGWLREREERRRG